MAQYEHRVVLERKLGRKLRPGEFAHHKNEIKADNRPRNLEPLFVGDHNRLHLAKTVAAKCGFCSATLIVHPYKLRYSKSGQVFCNNQCAGRFNNGHGVRGTPFSKTEDRFILAKRQQGWSWCRIGNELNRNRESIADCD